MARRGALIVFEGCDRCGKTTQCKLLVEKLNSLGIPTEAMRFPDRTTNIGSMIGRYLSQDTELDDHVVHLLFSANRWELQSRILELLRSGTSVVVDRYAYSGVAFTAAKEGFSLSWCRQPDVGLPQPDVVYNLTLSPEVMRSRGDFGKERYEKSDFQSRVAKNFELLRDEYWKMIDADTSIEELHSTLLDDVKRVIEQVAQQPISKLWMNFMPK